MTAPLLCPLAVPRRLLALSCCGVLASSCAGTAPPARGAEPQAPLAPPGPGASGCVESPELKAFVLALEAERSKARARALLQLGMVERPRPSRFVEGMSSASTGATLQAEGQRLAVVARLATAAPPLLPLAQREQLLHPIDERPRAHPIPVFACGVNACPPAVSPQIPPVRAVAVELAAGEQLGPPLQLSYDYWWAQVSYDRRRSCPAPGAAVPPPGGASTR